MEPFRFGCIVGDEHYCVRPQLEKEMKRHIYGGQNLVIQGERRMGKTSLVKRAISDMKGERLLYIDLYGIRTLSDFCRRVMAGVGGVIESTCQCRRHKRSLGWAQTKPWAEGIRVPAPLAGRGSTTARGILRLCPASACQTGLPWSSPPA